MNKLALCIHYKDGLCVSHASHLETTFWHRDTSITKKSRKPFTCVCGCNIPVGSTYLTLEMMAGSGRADAIADFALCKIHQNETEALLGRPISREVDTDEIIKAWVKILQLKSEADKPKAQTVVIAKEHAISTAVGSSSYSWEKESELCVIKTVDKTFIDEDGSGIPKGIVSFFTGRLLNEGEEQFLEFSLLGTLMRCKISRKQGRHRIFLTPFKRKLAELGLKIGDWVFFERDVSATGRFIVSALNQNNEFVASALSSMRTGRDREIQTTARVGQGAFRKQIKLVHGNRCCISGVVDIAPSILIASHIKPWSMSNSEEKVDMYNGLLLAPHYDKLFDNGLISFSDSGKLMLSSRVSDSLVQEWGLENRKLSTVKPQTKAYLGFHREYFKL